MCVTSRGAPRTGLPFVLPVSFDKIDNNNDNNNSLVMYCHATDGPPGPSVAKYVAVDGPPGPSMAAIDGPPNHLWRRKWSPMHSHRWSPLNYRLK